MRTALRLVCCASLAGTIVPPVLFLAGSIDLPATKLCMALSAVAWFVATPFWSARDEGGS